MQKKWSADVTSLANKITFMRTGMLNIFSAIESDSVYSFAPRKWGFGLNFQLLHSAILFRNRHLVSYFRVRGINFTSWCVPVICGGVEIKTVYIGSQQVSVSFVFLRKYFFAFYCFSFFFMPCVFRCCVGHLQNLQKLHTSSLLREKQLVMTSIHS